MFKNGTQYNPEIQSRCTGIVTIIYLFEFSKAQTSTSENKPAQHFTLNGMVVGKFKGRESLGGHDE